MDMAEYLKRKNPFYFLDELYKSLAKLEEEAKNIVLLYERDVNMPERKDRVPFETPFMLYLKHRRIRRSGFNPNKVFKFLERSNPHLKLKEIIKTKDDAKKLKESLEYAEGEQLEYLYSLEKYRLERMRIIGWSLIKNAFYVMDWASRVVETASAASNMIQAFGDELDLPAGLTADLSKLASLAMDVAGYVQRGTGSPQIWAYRIQSKSQAGVIKDVSIKEGKDKFIMLSQPLYTLTSGNIVKFVPESVSEETKNYWKVPIWGVLSIFMEKGEELEWHEKEGRGDIIMFLYTAYAKVLTSNFDRVYYECWNRLKMVIKKVKLAMYLLQTKQKLITQLMKAAPMPEQPFIEGAEIKSPEEVGGE